MPSTPVHKNDFTEFMGVNLKADKISMPSVFATGGKNCAYGQRGNIIKRPGSHTKQISNNRTIGIDGYVLMQREGVDTNGARVEEILGLQGTSTLKLVRLEKQNLLITYAGAGAPELETVYNAANDLILNLYVDDVSVLAITLTNQTPSAIDILITAVADFTSTSTENDAEAVTFQITPKTAIKTGGIRQFYYTTSEIPNGGFAAAGGSAGALPTTYKNPSSVNINGVLYHNDPNKKIWKYDGHYHYLAGMSKVGLATLAGVTGGGAMVAGATYTYASRAKFIDEAGNVTYSGITFETVTLGGGDNSVLLSNTHIGPLIESQGNLLHVDVTATGTSNIIPVTTSADFRVGDHISTSNNAAGHSPISRSKITSIAPTAITVEDTVAYTNGEEATHGYTIEIFRTIATGGSPNEAGPFFYVHELTPRWSGLGTGQVTDTSDDATLATNATLDARRRWADKIPSGTILSSFQNSLIIAGDEEAPGVVHFSDQAGSEQFDLAVNNFIVDGAVRAVGSTKEQLAVFKKTNTDVLTGDLRGFNVRIDRVDDDLGCLSHESIRIIDDAMIHFLSNKGPWKMLNGILSPLGAHQTKAGKLVSRLEPFFVFDQELQFDDLDASDTTERYNFDRAIGGHWEKKNLYLLFIPKETRTDQPLASSNSVIWAFDYEKESWLPMWEGLKAPGGIKELYGEMFLLDRELNVNTNGVLSQLMNTASIYDFQDDGDAIAAEYEFNWEHFGAPSVFKKYVRLNIFAHEPVENPTFLLDLKTENDFQVGNTKTNIVDSVVTTGTNRKFKLKGSKAKSQRIIVANDSLHENISINGYTLEYCTPYRRAIKQ